MIKDGYGGVKMCRVQAGQTMSTAAPRRHGDAQLAGAILTSAVVCSIGFTIGFHNHREGLY